MNKIILPALAALTAACSQTNGDRLPDNAAEPAPADVTANDMLSEPGADGAIGNDALPPLPAPAKTRGPIARDLVIAEWNKAENKAGCAPLVFTDADGHEGKPRRANFSGGWAVAFDEPNLRSAYGLAGTGVRIEDEEKEIGRIAKQWPHVKPAGRSAGTLDRGAIAAYGVEGTGDYPADNPNGRGLKSLAYVIVPGEQCLYNVWSSIGRDHLETLIDGLSRAQD